MRKGGAGKSTLTLHWAVEAERQGKSRVAVIDIDPQQTSVKWSKRRVQLGKQTPAMLVATAMICGKRWMPAKPTDEAGAHRYAAACRSAMPGSGEAGGFGRHPMRAYGSRS